MLETYSLILNFIFHNMLLYFYWSGSFTRLVVVSAEYCGLVVTVHLFLKGKTVGEAHSISLVVCQCNLPLSSWV
jgi:hypothetical protein